MTAVARESLRVAPLDGAAAIEESQWNRLARRGFHLHRWFTVAEESGWAPRHCGVFGPEGIRAVLPAYCAGPESLHDLHDRWLGRFGEVARRAGLCLRPTIAVGAPFAASSDLLGDAHDLPAATLDALFEALEEQARLDGARAVVWPFLELGGITEQRIREVAGRRGYLEVHAGATAYLRVEWSGFEDYLASRSKSVRRTVREDLRNLDRAGVTIESTSDFGTAAGRLEALFRQGFREHNGREAPLPPGYLRRLAAAPVPGLWAQLLWQGPRLVGGSINVAAGGIMEGTFAGFVDSSGTGAGYYSDLVYEPVRTAERQGLRWIHLGATALYPKVLRGARLRRRVTLVRGTTRVAHQAIKALGGVVDRYSEFKERKRLGALGAARCFE